MLSSKGIDAGRENIMRGPKPTKLILAVEHVEILQKHLQTGKTERRVADRARILLLSAEGLNPCVVAERTGHDRTTVWRVCQRYKERGLNALQDGPRGGNRTRFSPSAGRPNGRPGLQPSQDVGALAAAMDLSHASGPDR